MSLFVFLRRLGDSLRDVFVCARGGLGLIAAFFGRPDARRWTAAVLFIALLGGAYAWKWPIHALFRGDETGAAEAVAGMGSRFGDFEVPLIAGFALLIAGCAAGRERLLGAGKVLLAAGLICAVAVPLGQFILAEARPRDGGAMRFFALHGHGVSGHAASAALLVWPIAGRLTEGQKKWIRAVAFFLMFAWAIVVAWSRMWDDKHFLWNVMLGAGIGLTSGWAACAYCRKRGGSMPG